MSTQTAFASREGGGAWLVVVVAVLGVLWWLRWYLVALFAVVGALFAVMVLTWLARYVLTNCGMRASMRRAAVIRARWYRHAHTTGLVIAERHASLRRRALRRPRDVPRMVRPRLRRIRCTPYGCVITARVMPGVGLSAWLSAEEALRAAWRFDRVKIVQRDAKYVTIHGFHAEPLAATLDSPLVERVGAGWRLRVKPGAIGPEDDILIGVSEDGERVHLNLAGGAHGLLAGVTRSGKSITVNTLLAAASLMRHVRLIVIDPNFAAAGPWQKTAYEVCTSTDPEDAADVLRELRVEMSARMNTFADLRTDRITRFDEETPLIVLVIDEASNYTKHADKRKAEAFSAELLAIASQGAKFGIRLWLISQKPDSTVLSTAIRTNLSDRICHRVDTVEDFLHAFPDGRALDLTAADRSMPQGVSVAQLGTMRAPVRMRSVYLPTEACWVIADAIADAIADVLAERSEGQVSEVRPQLSLVKHDSAA
jgi:DNA segregation ATPase FtsK/SpoIIIE, S-DNA-T family